MNNTRELIQMLLKYWRREHEDGQQTIKQRTARDSIRKSESKTNIKKVVRKAS
jgi:hypothetical protein